MLSTCGWLAAGAQEPAEEPVTEVVVVGDRPAEEVSRRVLDADELRRVPGAFGDPIRALQSLPGVARARSFEGAIVVRGAEPLNTATYVDEIPVPYLFHFFVGRSVINPAFLDDVEFFPGGVPSRFGDATQAVVNARTASDPPASGVDGVVTADLLDFSVAAAGRLGDRWSWQLGGRAAWVGLALGVGVQAYSLARGLGGDRPGYATLGYTDQLARLRWDGGVDEVALTWLGANDALREVPERINGEPPPIPELPYDPYRIVSLGFQRLHLRWDRRLGRREQVTWLAAGPEWQQNLLEGIGQFTDALENGRTSGWMVAARREDRWPLGPQLLATGANAWVNPAVAEDFGDWGGNGPVPTTGDLRASAGVWVEPQLRHEGLWVAPGLRGAVHTFSDQANVEPEPRLSVRQRIAEPLVATAFVGRATQIPPLDRYAEGLGNPELGLIRAWQASTGIEVALGGGWTADLTAFGSLATGMVARQTGYAVVPALGTGESAGPPEWANGRPSAAYAGVDGRAYGVEAMVRLRPAGPWFGWLAVTLARSEREWADGWLPSDYDAPWSGTLVAGRTLPRAWSLSGRFQAAAGYPYTPLDGVYVPSWDLWMGAPGAFQSERFPPWHRLDVRVDKTWHARRRDWTAFLDVQNVLNVRNPLLASYTPNYDATWTTVYIPILPNLGVEATF